MKTLVQALDDLGSPRYSDCASMVWGNWEVIALEGEADYQGSVEFIARDPTKPDRFVKYGWSYGSCSGCDTWEAEDLDDQAICKEMEREAVYYDEAALNTLRIMLDRTTEEGGYRHYEQPPMKDQIEAYMRERGDRAASS